MTKVRRSGWYVRSRYQGVPHWFKKGESVSVCGLLKYQPWASDPPSFMEVGRVVGGVTGCYFCLKKKGRRGDR